MEASWGVSITLYGIQPSDRDAKTAQLVYMRCRCSSLGAKLSIKPLISSDAACAIFIAAAATVLELFRQSGTTDVDHLLVSFHYSHAPRSRSAFFT